MRPHERLEQEWAKFNNLDPAGMVACSSGTSALVLALESLQLPQGTECIIPDFTMVACPRAAITAGMVPVFVDCDDKLNMNLKLLSELIKSSPKAQILMLVDVYGRKTNWEMLKTILHETYPSPKFIIEDMSESHGLNKLPFSDAVCWSMYSNKIVAGQEGGAVWFADKTRKKSKLARQLRSLGFTDAHNYNHIPRGGNYRMSDAHAELILASLRDYEDRWTCGSDDVSRLSHKGNKTHRREIESWYDEYCPAEWRQPARDAVWIYDIRIPNLCESVQDEIVRKLRLNGIEARHGFKPMHAQEEFKGCRRVGGENADRASREVIYLPVQPGVTTRRDAERAFDIVRSAVARA